MKREENSVEAECIEKLCNLFIFTSPSVLKIQFLALYGQREEVLLFILHTLTFLYFEHFLNYMQNNFWNQILMLWWPITEKRNLRRNMVKKQKNNGRDQKNRFPHTHLKDYIKSCKRVQTNIDRFVRWINLDYKHSQSSN